MIIEFSIEYHTHWGEELFLRKGDESYPMRYVQNGIWSVRVNAEKFFGEKNRVEYFYEVRTEGISTRHEWRSHTIAVPHTPGTVHLRDFWSDIPGWKGAGTAIPVFSLRTKDSFGSGEFMDLKKLVDWAALTGQSVIQLLPINDTTMSRSWEDSYPYNANSSFALHPQYISIIEAGVEPDEDFYKIKEELEALPHVDYEKANSFKEKYLKKAFERTRDTLQRQSDYKEFIRQNASWLIPYAVWRALRDEYDTPDFREWGDMAKFTKAKVKMYSEANKKEIDYHCFVQYHLDRQLRQARDYAHSKAVILKGDLPIGVSRDSADAWQFPELFNLDSQAGAPPDAFSADGQNWGFPTYNWKEMSKDSYAWWKARLKKMSEYFDAFRIDHILGFFRIWEIPVPVKSGLEGHFSPAMPYSGEDLQGLGVARLTPLFLEDPHSKGAFHPRINAKQLPAYAQASDAEKSAFDALYEDFFYHRHNDFWGKGAVEKLSSLLGSTGMLACAEDLGMIPSCVTPVMRHLNILSLEIQRMSKHYGEIFADPASYPYTCVCTTSTHDMSPLRAWWREDRGLTQHYYNDILHHPGEAPYDCTEDICRDIVASHLHSPAMLTILPLQDWLSMSEALRYKGAPENERINIPAKPRHYWRYRMHLKIEKLIEAEDFNALVTKMISESSRSTHES